MQMEGGRALTLSLLSLVYLPFVVFLLSRVLRCFASSTCTEMEMNSTKSQQFSFLIESRKTQSPFMDVTADEENDGSKTSKQAKSCDKSSPSKKHEGSKKSSPSSLVATNFSKLLEGVVFVLSGFVNLERSTLRSQALEMGAEYQQDWNSNCTFLVCAFSNTPKFRQVEADCRTIVSKRSGNKE